MKNVCITEKQKNIHVASEAVAVFLLAPYMLWASARVKDPGMRNVFRTVAVGTLLIDGYLLFQYSKHT